MYDKDVIITQLTEKNRNLPRQVIQLMELVQALRDKIARLEKNSSNSSKPPSSDIVDPHPDRKNKRKRRIGGQNGHSKHRRPMFEADEVDQTIIRKLPAEEVHRLGLIKLNETESALQQIDLPEQLFKVIEHRVQLYVDPNGEIIKAKLPKDIRKVPLIGTDETGHKNPAYKSAWTWCQQTPEAVFYYISNSRASQVLIDILGRDFSGTVICDYFSANKKFVNDNNIAVQYCWVHLIRDIKFLTLLAYRNVRHWAEGLLEIRRRLFELWKTRRWRQPGRYSRTIENLRKRFLRKVRRPPDNPEALTIKKRFKASGEKGSFLFLEGEGVPPTNNRTEQAMRFVVIDRRITQGTRSWAGMRFCERAWTVVATCTRHNQSVYQFFLEALISTYSGTAYPKLIPEKV